MIPSLTDEGYLPSGIHRATLDEIAARFGQETEIRRVQMESLRWLIDLARRAGAQRILVNGSFVTDKSEPNDVDCVLLIGADYPRDAAADAELLDGLPFVDLDLAGPEVFTEFVERVFALDRRGNPKGLIEVMA